MADSDPDDSVNAVAMKLPLFWVDNPLRWFQQAEAQFRIKNITRSSTKFEHVLARIPSEATVSIGDVIDKATAAVNPSEPSVFFLCLLRSFWGIGSLLMVSSLSAVTWMPCRTFLSLRMLPSFRGFLG